jgi:transcriptional regulator with XRE-family HTH domain
MIQKVQIMKQRFIDIRVARAETQSETALRVGLSMNVVNGFETGRMNQFAASTRRKLALAYNVTIEEIDAACGKSEPASAT